MDIDNWIVRKLMKEEQNKRYKNLIRRKRERKGSIWLAVGDIADMIE